MRSVPRNTVCLLMLLVPMMLYGQAPPVLELESRVDEGVESITAVTFDPDGSLYALEPQGRRLLKIEPDGSVSSQSGGFFRPTDVVMAGFELWVLDPPRGWIARYDRRLANLSPIRKLMETEASIPLNGIISAAFSSGDVITLLDSYEQQLYLVTLEGRLIDIIEGFGNLPVSMISPVRVEIAADGRIAVADESARAVFLFDRFGGYVSVAPFPGAFTRGPLGVAWQGKRLWAGGRDGLVVYNENRDLIAMWPREQIGGDVLDLAVDGDRLAVATETGVRFFRIGE